MKNRVFISIVTSITGTIVLIALGALLHGLIGDFFDVTFCAIGSFVATMICLPKKINKYASILISSVGVVFITFLFISTGHALNQYFIRNVSVDFEPVGKFIWATITTSWWLIPMTSFVIFFCNKYSPYNENKKY